MHKPLLALVSAFSLVGCANVPQAKLPVQIATMKVIESETDRAAKAQRIIAAAEQAKTLLDVDGVTVADLKAAVLERLQSRGLEPSDLLLATLLVDTVAAELDTRIGEGVLSPESKVTVNQFLGYVIEAARFYV